MRDEHLKELEILLIDAGAKDINANEFRRYGSARKLYNFNINDVQAY